MLSLGAPEISHDYESVVYRQLQKYCPKWLSRSKALLKLQCVQIF